MTFSFGVLTCLNTRVPADPMPTFNGLKNPVGLVELGDHVYNDGTDDRFDIGLGSVSYPKGSGAVLTLPAPVNGKIPTGAVTVTNGGTGHPISRTADFGFWVRDPSSGAVSGYGLATTNGSGVITAATITYGGKAGDYTYSGSRAFTEGTDLFTISHAELHAWRSKMMVQTTTPMKKLAAMLLWRFLCPDDHEAWNGGYPGAFGGSKSPATVTTVAQSYDFWQTASTGVRLLLDQEFNNPAWTDPVTPYVPNGLTSLGLTGTEPFFKIRYFYRDLDKFGKIVTNPTGAVCRLIFLDCLFEKGNYTTGVDDSSRNLISTVQEAWLDTVQASAVAAGIQSIGIMSSKDRFSQNSDGWISFITQWNRIWANIQAKNYPTWIVTGDRHVPHAGQMRFSDGDPADAEVVCMTAFGATSDAIQLYPRMIWADQSPDVPVVGSVTVDTVRRCTILTIHEMGTGRAKYSVKIRFGERRAYETHIAQPRITRPTPTPFQTVEFRYTGLWANRPTTGLRLQERAFFTDVGQGGSEWVWDGTYWVPMAPVVLFRGAGTVAAPLATLTGVTSGTFATPGNVPAGMFIKPGMELLAQARFARSTAAATGAQVVAGFGGTGIGRLVFSNNIGQTLRIHASMMAVTSATQLRDNQTPPHAQAAGTITDTALNFANSQAFTLSLEAANAADSFTLLSYSLTLYP